MNLSVLNSFDNTKLYNGALNTLPFTGTYESIGNATCIYIFAYLIENGGPDTLEIQFSNDINASKPVVTKTYIFEEGNKSNHICIIPVLSYFRIKITGNEPVPAPNLKRIYNKVIMNLNH